MLKVLMLLDSIVNRRAVLGCAVLRGAIALICEDNYRNILEQSEPIL